MEAMKAEPVYFENRPNCQVAAAGHAAADA